MPKFSQSSLNRLHTVHSDLQILFKVIIEHVDCTIISGLRSVKEQQVLYAKGRTEPGNIVTYKDGVNSKSKHQGGLAVDVIAYPSLYKDIDKMIEFGGFVKGIAIMLKEQGFINSEIEWGGNWRWSDKPHFQIKM